MIADLAKHCMDLENENEQLRAQNSMLRDALETIEVMYSGNTGMSIKLVTDMGMVAKTTLECSA